MSAKHERRMVVHLNLSRAIQNKDCHNAKLHYMPCTIGSNGEAKVSVYFEPIITEEYENDERGLKASFRGYPLDGKEISVPENYIGLVLEETNCNNKKGKRNIYGKYLFDKITYWNWDAKPSQDDKLILALDWIDISEAVSAFGTFQKMIN